MVPFFLRYCWITRPKILLLSSESLLVNIQEYFTVTPGILHYLLFMIHFKF